MTMTQGSLLTEIRDSLNEASTGQWTDPMLRRWINEAMRDISRKCEVLLTTATIAVTSATDTYTLPTDLIRIHRAEYYEGSGHVTKLEPMDVNTMDSLGWGLQGSGRPFAFAPWGNVPAASIILYPKPDTTGTVKVWYYQLATELLTDGSAANTALDVPEGWYDAIKDYVSYKARRRDRDPLWREDKELYDEKVADLMEMTRLLHDNMGQMYPSSNGHMVPQYLWDSEW